MSEPSPLFRANHDREHIIKEIRRFCPGKDFEILDMLSNYSNMSNIISAFQATNEAKESDNNGEVFKKFYPRTSRSSMSPTKNIKFVRWIWTKKTQTFK